MTSDHTHHPGLARLARFLPRGIVRSWTRLPLALGSPFAMRFMFRKSREVRVGNASIFVYRPAGAPERAPALLWMHGGGLLIGDARQDGPMLTDWADDLGIVVASVQYRLAPQHPHPAALDDCVAAFDWLTEQSDIDQGRLMVGGSSAGGNLAAALSQRLTERGTAAPSFQLLVYPMLDNRSSFESGPADHLHRVWDRTSNAQAWREYLADSPAVAPAVPARAEDLSGLPPAWIGVGDADMFLEEDVAYADRLRSAGVDVELEIVPGAYHAFDLIDKGAAVSKDFIASQKGALARHLQANPAL